MPGAVLFLLYPPHVYMQFFFSHTYFYLSVKCVDTNSDREGVKGCINGVNICKTGSNVLFL